MSKEKNKPWGGKRAGAGRPTTGDSVRVRIGAFVEAATLDAIKRTAKATKRSQGQVIDSLAESLGAEKLPPQT